MVPETRQTTRDVVGVHPSSRSPFPLMILAVFGPACGRYRRSVAVAAAVAASAVVVTGAIAAVAVAGIAVVVAAVDPASDVGAVRV